MNNSKRLRVQGRASSSPQRFRIGTSSWRRPIQLQLFARLGTGLVPQLELLKHRKTGPHDSQMLVVDIGSLTMKSKHTMFSKTNDPVVINYECLLMIHDEY